MIILVKCVHVILYVCIKAQYSFISQRVTTTRYNNDYPELYFYFFRFVHSMVGWSVKRKGAGRSSAAAAVDAIGSMG